MITKNHRKELLSLSYIHAVAAVAGANVSAGDIFDYGVDVSLKRIDKAGSSLYVSGIQFDIQLKATGNWRDLDNEIAYDMEQDAYDRIVYRSTVKNASPIILGVMCLSDEVDWLSLSPDELILRRCCYWTKVVGNSANKYKTVVRLPKTQPLTPLSIRTLFARIEAGTF